MKSWKKDPNSELDYAIDWSTWLAASETISTSTWILESGITKLSDTKTSTTTTVWISGGTASIDYTVTNRIITSAGRTVDRSFILFVRER